MSRWDELTMAQKSELIGIAVKQGITDLNTVREMYNNSSPIESNVSGSRRFDDGGFVNPGELAPLDITPLIKSVKRKIDNLPKSLEEVRQRLYDNVIPFGYNNPTERVYNAVIKNKKEQYDPAYGVSSDTAETLDDLWGTYLNIPENKRHNIDNSNGIIRSALPDNKEYYQLKNLDPIINEVVKAGLGYSDRYQKYSVAPYNYVYFPPIKLGQIANVYQNQVLGDYQVGRGYDDKGEYLSYSDVWDINPFQRTFNLYGQDNPEDDSWVQSIVRNISPKIGDASFGLGNPVNIYGKIYLDDIYDVPEPTHSTYLPEVVVYGKNKQKME